MRFQIVNIGLIIALLINFFISFIFISLCMDNLVAGFGITIMVFICFIGILYTPIGDWWYRKIVFRLREPDERERKRLEPIYKEVYKRALIESPSLSKDIKIFVYEDNDINAFAIGLKTIAVHKGLLYNNIYDNEIAAILGHEFAHIANGDTFCTILALQSNVIVYVIRLLFYFIMILAAKMVGFMGAIIMGVMGANVKGITNGFSIGDNLTKWISRMIDGCTSFFVFISIIIAQYSRRKHELEADNFAAKLGYGRFMIQFFQRFPDIENVNNKFSLSYLLHGTHPSMSVRIANLQKNSMVINKNNHL